jgi:hypothetical protein
LRKSALASAVALAVAFLPACNDEQTPTNPTASPSPSPGASPAAEATIAAVTVTPNPVLVPAVATGDPTLPWAISWQLTVRETAGIAATVTTIDVYLDSLVVTYSGDALTASSTTASTALAARGTLTFNQSLFYSLADGGRLAVVSVVVWLRDQRGNVISQAAQLRIV